MIIIGWRLMVDDTKRVYFKVLSGAFGADVGPEYELQIVCS